MGEQIAPARRAGHRLHGHAGRAGLRGGGGRARARADLAGGRAIAGADAHLRAAPRPCRKARRSPLSPRRGATLAIHLSIHVLDQVVGGTRSPHYGADCPVAIVFRASWPDERIVESTLGDIVARMREEPDRAHRADPGRPRARRARFPRQRALRRRLPAPVPSASGAKPNDARASSSARRARAAARRRSRSA